MDDVLRNYQFTLMDDNEMMLIDGGGAIGKAFAAAGAAVLIAAGAVSVMVGVGLAVGSGGAGALPAVKLACAGVGAIIAGAKMLDALYN